MHIWLILRIQEKKLYEFQHILYAFFIIFFFPNILKSKYEAA